MESLVESCHYNAQNQDLPLPSVFRKKNQLLLRLTKLKTFKLIGMFVLLSLLLVKTADVQQELLQIFDFELSPSLQSELTAVSKGAQAYLQQCLAVFLTPHACFEQYYLVFSSFNLSKAHLQVPVMFCCQQILYFIKAKVAFYLLCC